MIINHNLPALNTYNKLANNQAIGQKSLEKLSSGLRINRAGDDAAGLAISEKMRAQVRGLDQAGRNAQDGISLIQTAEGGLNEVHSILQRMRELADQSANGTNTADDRSAIQSEITQLKAEIDRVGNTTEFNTQKLLNGSLSSTGAAVGLNSTTGASVAKLTAASMTSAGSVGIDHSGLDFTVANKDTFTIDGHDIEVDWNALLTQSQKDLLDANHAGASTSAKTQIKDTVINALNTAIDNYNATNTAGASVAHVIGFIDSTTGGIKIESATSGIKSNLTIDTGAATTVGARLLSDNANADSTTQTGTSVYNGTTVASGAKFDMNVQTNDGRVFKLQVTTTGAITGGTTSMAGAATQLQTDINTAITAYNTAQGKTQGQAGFIEAAKVVASDDGRFVITNESATLTYANQEGSTVVSDLGLTTAQTESSGNGGMTFQIGANKGQTMNFGIGDMRTSALGVAGLDVSTAAGASQGLSALDTAIKSVSSERAKLGAVQNRLEHTINNLSTSSENLTAAESRIRDVDMAKEMMSFSKMNILSQAAQAMMAQANQAPQGVLQLLR